MSKSGERADNGDRRLTIGELARSVGVTTRTVRYYEEIGILPTPDRSEAGTRTYQPEWKFYLEGALILKDLGFNLDEIRTVGQIAFGVELSQLDHAAAVDLLNSKLEDLRRRLHVMEVIRLRVVEVTDGAPLGSVLAPIVSSEEPTPAASTRRLKDSGSRAE
jgi:DNA-binding transcriptional MerR regulator